MMQAESIPAQITTLTEEVEGVSIEGLEDIRGTGNRAEVEAIEIHGKFKSFFNNTAPVEWPAS